MNVNASGIIRNNEQKRKGSDDDEDDGITGALENVLADLEDVDYKTYTISKEEIEKYKETMRLRMEYTEEKRSHEILNLNLEHIKQTKANAINNKSTFNIANLTLPEEAKVPNLSEEKLLEILHSVI